MFHHVLLFIMLFLKKADCVTQSHGTVLEMLPHLKMAHEVLSKFLILINVRKHVLQSC